MTTRSHTRTPPSLKQLIKLGNKQMADAHQAVAQSAELAEQTRQIHLTLVENHNEPLPFRRMDLFLEEVEGT